MRCDRPLAKVTCTGRTPNPANGELACERCYSAYSEQYFEGTQWRGVTKMHK